MNTDAPTPSPVVVLTDVVAVLGDFPALAGASLVVGRGEIVLLRGPNGAGKTTLLRLLVGQLEPDAGKVQIGQTVKVAYLSQEVVELPPKLRVLEAVQEIAHRIQVGDRELSAGQLAEMFGFTSARQWTPVGDLSGGERRRLQLLRLLMGEPNVLLLDEPTNDLDIDTLNALEDLLDSWPGTLIVVSHDRYLVERVCDNVWALMGDGKIMMLTGGIEEYLDRRRAAAVIAPSGGAGATPIRSSGGSGVDSRAAKKELTKLERQVAKLDTKEAQLHASLAEHATDYERVASLDAELRELQAQRDQLEEAWLHLSEQL